MLLSIMTSCRSTYPSTMPQHFGRDVPRARGGAAQRGAAERKRNTSSLLDRVPDPGCRVACLVFLRGKTTKRHKTEHVEPAPCSSTVSGNADFAWEDSGCVCVCVRVCVCVLVGMSSVASFRTRGCGDARCSEYIQDASACRISPTNSDHKIPLRKTSPGADFEEISFVIMLW